MLKFVSSCLHGESYEMILISVEVSCEVSPYSLITVYLLKAYVAEITITISVSSEPKYVLWVDYPSPMLNPTPSPNMSKDFTFFPSEGRRTSFFF